MTKLIPDFEDAIYLAKEDFFNSFNKTLISVTNIEEERIIQEGLNEFHSKAIKFFNLFERSINEYGLDHFNLNDDIRIRKVEDAINIANAIADYWELLNNKIPTIKKYSLITPIIPKKAYGSLQRFLNTYAHAEVSELRKRFKEAKIPTDGFDSKDKHKSMSTDLTQNFFLEMLKNHKVTLIGLIVILLGLIFSFKDSISTYISGSSVDEKEQVDSNKRVTLVGNLIYEKSRNPLDGVTVYIETQSSLRDIKISNGNFTLTGVLLPPNGMITIMIEDRYNKVDKTRPIDLNNKLKYPINNGIIDLGTEYVDK